MRLPSSLGALTSTSPLVQQLAAAITRQEGTTQNNNPGNLVYVGQAGATGADSRGFAIFPTLAAGQQAQAAQIARDINSGCPNGAAVSTLTDLISCWSTTDRTAYTANVASWTGIDPNAPLLSVDMGGSSVQGTADASTGIDLTDPTTWAIAAGVGLLAVFLLRR